MDRMMDDATRPSLLIRVRDSRDRDAWNQFAVIYSPLIQRFAIKQGLQDADAADIVPEVFGAVARSIGKLEYDPNTGRFRSWLFKITHNKIKNHLSKLQRNPQGTGDTAANQMLAQLATGDDQSDLWDREYEQRLFEWAVEQVQGQFREQTWQAFWMTAVKQKSPGDVAAELGINVGAVYVAKSRVLAELKQKTEGIGEKPPV